MHFNILTIFPEMFPGTLGAGVVGRALDKGLWSYNIINIRDFAYNNYGSVDDEQFGAGDIMELDTGEMVSFIGADADITAKKVWVK